MLNTFLLAFRIDSAIAWNTFIYHLQGIPLLGKLVRDRWFGLSAAKTNIAVLVAVKDFLWAVLRQFFYFGLILWLPLIFLASDASFTEESILLALETRGNTVFIWGFFVMDILLGAWFRHMLKASYTDSSRTKLVFMNLDPREYYLSQAIASYIFKFVFMLPAFAFFAFLHDVSFRSAVILYIGMFAIRIFADGVYFTKPGFHLRGKRNGMSLPTMLYLAGGLILYLLPLYLLRYMDAELLDTACSCVSGLPGLAVYAVLGLLGIFLIRKKADYVYLRKQELQEGEWQQMNLDDMKNSEDIAFKDTDADLSRHVPVEGKKGYEYLNALFFARHRSLFAKRMKNTLILIPLVGITGAVICRLVMEDSVVAINHILDNVGIFIFIVYLIAYRETFTKALFANVDRYLLHYNWYRNPDVILKNYMIRLRRSFFLNFAMSGSLMLTLIAATMISGGDLLKTLPALGIILVLTLFYSIHYLTLYYLVQPYTEELEAESYLYKISNFVIYFASYMAMQNASIGGEILIGISIVLVVYLAIALLLLRKLAPKTFRLR